MSALGWTYIPENNREDQLIAERDTARAALQRILELAERSDAHPELPIADIAREALGK